MALGVSHEEQLRDLERQRRQAPVATITSTPDVQPGCCLFTEAAPTPENGLRLLDLGTENQWGERKYISDQLVKDLAGVLGMVSAEQHAAVANAADELREQLEQAQERLARLADVHEELVTTVAYTLQHGLVVDVDKKRVKLRPVPGTRVFNLPEVPADAS